MSGMKVEIIGYKEIEAKLDRLPIEVADAAIGDVQDYMLNVLKSDQPTPKHVSRKSAYGQTFESDRQRRWFFANLKDGTIKVPYKRTQGLSRGWKVINRGLTGYIVNELPGAWFVVGDNTQSRHEKLVGWKTVGQQVQDRLERINRIIDTAAKKALRKLGL